MNTSSATPPVRRTRSFVRRQGRMTEGQRRAIDQFASRYMLDVTQVRELLLQDDSPWVLEIGFGMGESLAQMAVAEPELHFLGIEVHRPGVGALLAAIDQQHIDNIRIVSADAMDVLHEQIPDGRLTRVQIFFPDPWPKKRHHKRRLINQASAQLLYNKLIPGGELHIATDWPDYAAHIENALKFVAGFSLLADKSRPARRPSTKFEQRGERLGHPIVDLRFIKSA